MAKEQKFPFLSCFNANARWKKAHGGAGASASMCMIMIINYFPTGLHNSCSRGANFLHFFLCATRWEVMLCRGSLFMLYCFNTLRCSVEQQQIMCAATGVGWVPIKNRQVRKNEAKHRGNEFMWVRFAPNDSFGGGLWRWLGSDRLYDHNALRQSTHSLVTSNTGVPRGVMYRVELHISHTHCWNREIINWANIGSRAMATNQR